MVFVIVLESILIPCQEDFGILKMAQDSNDELNLVEPGFNSGWQDLMGMAPAGFNFNNLGELWWQRQI